MKGNVINTIVIVVIIVVMAALIIPWPREFVKDFTGIKYQLGPDNKTHSESVQISFSGTFKESYFGLLDDRFVGYITIDGINIKEDEEFNLSFNEEKNAILSHTYFVKSERAMLTSSYGRLYIDEGFEEFTIELYFGKPNNKSFNSFDGFMVSAPATNREEALLISKKFVSYRDDLQ